MLVGPWSTNVVFHPDHSMEITVNHHNFGKRNKILAVLYLFFIILIFQGWKLKFQSTHHLCKWPSSCTCPDNFHSPSLQAPHKYREHKASSSNQLFSKLVFRKTCCLPVFHRSYLYSIHKFYHRFLPCFHQVFPKPKVRPPS